MKTPTKQYEIIYLLSYASNTKEDGVILTFLALDAFADYLFPPMVVPEFKSIEQMAEAMINFFNGINENYDRNKHAQNTTYITNMEQTIHPFIEACMMTEDSLVYDPKSTEQVFKPVLEHFGIRM